jgi:hypothetical protein
MSVATQTLKPDRVVIYDDSSNRIPDMRQIEVLDHIFQLFANKGILVQVVFGRNRGQHVGHQHIQEEIAEDLIWRIDDDEIAENNVLEELMKHMVEGVGAVGGLILPPNAIARECEPNRIAIPNECCQWYKWTGVKEVEHINSSYLYRKGIQDFDINLSHVAHREETLHTYGIFKKGYKLIVTSSAVTWHLRSNQGGIRSAGGQEAFFRDEIAFREALREYHGKIKKKYKEVTLAVCWPEVFPDEKTISVSEGAMICNPEKHNVGKWGIDHKWREELKYAYAEMYGVKVEDEEEWPVQKIDKTKPILISRGVKKLRNNQRSAKDYPWWDEGPNKMAGLIPMLRESGYEVKELDVEIKLPALKEMVEGCSTVICCDSFMQHFCWSIKKRAVVLWGVGDPFVFGHKEHLNLLKSRNNIRENQFEMWEGVKYNPDVFMTPDQVVAHIKKVTQ